MISKEGEASTAQRRHRAMNEGTWKYFWANKVSTWGERTFDFGQQAFNFGQTLFFILGTHVWIFWANEPSILGKQAFHFGQTGC